jgi:hypothetical protein
MKKFNIRLENIKYIETLSDESAGILFKSLFDYHINEVRTPPKNLEIIYMMIVDQFEHDNKVSMKRKESGAKAKTNFATKTEAKVSKSKQNSHDNQSVTIDIRRKQFAEDMKVFIKDYHKDMLNEFYLYWSEPSKSGNKMRFEMEKTWELGLRLQRWAKNNKQFGNNPKTDNREIIIPKI